MQLLLFLGLTINSVAVAYAKDGAIPLLGICSPYDKTAKKCASGLRCIPFQDFFTYEWRCYFESCKEQQKYADKYGYPKKLLETTFGPIISEVPQNQKEGGPLPHPRIDCDADGNYEIITCADDGCFCASPFKGGIDIKTLLVGQKKDTVQCDCPLAPPSTGTCSRENGSWLPVQCQHYGALGPDFEPYCYCVDTRTGDKIEDIATVNATLEEVKTLPCLDKESDEWYSFTFGNTDYNDMGPGMKIEPNGI